MNFKGHFLGGMAAGGAAVSLALSSGASGLDLDVGAGDSGFTQIGAIFATAWFMALFPDLDTASVPQRWFLRGMFTLLVAALVWERMDIFVILAFATILPLLHRHRGWTHWKITPWVIALFLAVVYEFMRARSAWVFGSTWSSFSWGNVWAFLREYWHYTAACVLGHYTHLLLDSRRVPWLPFIRNSAAHH